ncbi:MAG: hypothetical protein IPJ90_22090 [Anaerolineaceae bacterium]|nr:hypothetical protein [Anaerolineaceae bacterium]
MVWSLIAAGFWLFLILAIGYLIFTKDGRRELPALVKLFARGFILAWVVLLVLRLDNAATEEARARRGRNQRRTSRFAL